MHTSLCNIENSLLFVTTSTCGPSRTRNLSLTCFVDLLFRLLSINKDKHKTDLLVNTGDIINHQPIKSSEHIFTLFSVRFDQRGMENL